MENILIVDDEENIQKLLSFRFQKEGYETDIASDGESCLEKLRVKIPHLIILDVAMPGINGFQTLEKIRNNIRTSQIPVIMLTAMDDIGSKLKGLKIGADDYIAKPFNIEELVLKAKNLIKRTLQESLTNPLSGLPGNELIKTSIEKLLKHPNDPWAILYIDLDNFKIYNDTYGFSKGDGVILLTSKILSSVLESYGNEKDFLGHIGGDDFLLITTIDKSKYIAENIIRDFDREAGGLYRKKDLEKGYIISKDRKGKTVKNPLISISIGIISSKNKGIKNYFQMGEALAEAKSVAKRTKGGSYFIERRDFDFSK